MRNLGDKRERNRKETTDEIFIEIEKRKYLQKFIHFFLFEKFTFYREDISSLTAFSTHSFSFHYGRSKYFTN
jgi:hypothetical protein